MQRMEEFLNLAVAGIRDDRKKAKVRAELEDHVMEKFEEYKRRGYSDEEAERRAVEDMGDGYELSEQMSKVHSFLPHVYYAKSVVLLIVALFYSYFNFSFKFGQFKINFFPEFIGLILMGFALWRFYPLGKKAKIAFWLFSVGKTISILNLWLAKDLPVLYHGVSILFLLLIPVVMTLLCLELKRIGKEDIGLNVVIGFEWIKGSVSVISRIVAGVSVGWEEGTVSLSGPIVTVSTSLAVVMIIGGIVELVLLGVFARRARSAEWDHKSNAVHVAFPVIFAVFYAVSGIVSVFPEFPSILADPNDVVLEKFEPNSMVWTGERHDILVTNGIPDDHINVIESIQTARYKVNVVQTYMDDEDYAKLASCEQIRLIGSFESGGKSSFSIVAEGKNVNYLVEFFYYEGYTNAEVMKHQIGSDLVQVQAHYRYFYRDAEDTVYTYEGIKQDEYDCFYVLKKRDTFGYAFCEFNEEYSDAHVSYSLYAHKYDLLFPERTVFKSDWQFVYAIGKKGKS